MCSRINLTDSAKIRSCENVAPFSKALCSPGAGPSRCCEKVAGEERVRVDLMIVAEEDVEAVFFGDAGGPPVAQPPLAKPAGDVTRA